VAGFRQQSGATLAFPWKKPARQWDRSGAAHAASRCGPQHRPLV